MPGLDETQVGGGLGGGLLVEEQTQNLEPG
jgi:hypothetical protein